MNVTTIHDDPLGRSYHCAKREYGIELHNNHTTSKYDAVILAIAHKKFNNLDIANLINGKKIVYDVKGFLSKKDMVDGKL